MKLYVLQDFERGKPRGYMISPEHEQLGIQEEWNEQEDPITGAVGVIEISPESSAFLEALDQLIGVATLTVNTTIWQVLGEIVSKSVEVIKTDRPDIEPKGNC